MKVKQTLVDACAEEDDGTQPVNVVVLYLFRKCFEEIGHKYGTETSPVDGSVTILIISVVMASLHERTDFWLCTEYFLDCASFFSNLREFDALLRYCETTV